MLYDVNILIVLVAAIAGFIISTLWYSIFFGKKWMKLTGISAEDAEKMKKEGGGKEMVLGFVSTFIMAYVLGYVLSLAGVVDAGGATILAAILWLGFIGTITLGSVLWEKKPFGLYLLNNEHNLLVLIVMSIIITLWG